MAATIYLGRREGILKTGSDISSICDLGIDLVVVLEAYGKTRFVL